MHKTAKTSNQKTASTPRKTRSSHKLNKQDQDAKTYSSNQEDQSWLINIAEPIESKINYYLNLLPNEFNIDIDTLLEIIRSKTTLEGGLDIYDVLRYLILRQRPNEHINLYPGEQMALSECFEFDIVQNPTINFFNHKMNKGTLRVVKVRHLINDKRLYSILEKITIDAITGIKLSKRSHIKRLNNFVELFNKKSILNTTSQVRLRLFLIEVLRSLYRISKLKIRSADLANSFGLWVKAYIEDNDQEAYAKLVKLKQLHETGQPLYLDSVQ